MTTYKTATLGGGCFWCLEAVYDLVNGVISVESGYSGGHVQNPSYKAVCEGITGHAEVVQITYDPEVISYHDLLNIFFTIHDPTTLNRQGADVGTRYRSVIFFNDGEQEATARQVIDEFERAGIWENPIVTQVEELRDFFIAEDYHQEYFENNPNQPYCSAVVSPKVVKFRSKFSGLLKS
jgi:peptide-methionine (S)-S-oxide reductase